MAPRRVVVTGLGIISPLGLNLADNWKALSEGRPGIGPIESVDVSHIPMKLLNAAQVRGFHAEKHFESGREAYLDRFAQFSVVAAREALRDSGVELNAALRENGAVVCGTAVGGQSAIECGFEDLYVSGRGRVHPLTIPKTMANAGASQISMDLGFTGPTYTVATACSSANHAIGQAFRLVRDGEAEMAVTGGSEAPFVIGMLKAWEAMRVIAPDTCRPFSKDRKGMILGEGGAMMILEPFEAAKARGARIYCEICGLGMSSDAHHLTQPLVDGPARAMRGALKDASLAPEEIGYINAHGTSTDVGDRIESGVEHVVRALVVDRPRPGQQRAAGAHCGGCGLPDRYGIQPCISARVRIAAGGLAPEPLDPRARRLKISRHRRAQPHGLSVAWREPQAGP